MDGDTGMRLADGAGVTTNRKGEWGTMTTRQQTLVRHEGDAPRERSTCGWRDRLISREDSGVVAWVHAVDIDGARPHYHKRATELYYVLEGEGVVVLDGEEHAVRKGSLVHIAPGVVHGAQGRMRVLVTGIPDIADDDLFFLDDE
jgi:quercetin dioxygenase-like cupin family protein